MRRGAGIGGLIQSQQQSTQYKSVGKQLEETQVEQLRSQLALFQSQLSSFASRYRADINANPILRYHFHTMCTSMGVDPLASSSALRLLLLPLLLALLLLRPVRLLLLSRRPHRRELQHHRSQQRRHHQHGRAAASPASPRLLPHLRLRRRHRHLPAHAAWAAASAILTLSAGQQMIRSVPTEMNVDEMRVMQWSSSRQTGGGGGGSRGGWSMRHMEDELKWTTRRVQEVTAGWWRAAWSGSTPGRQREARTSTGSTRFSSRSAPRPEPSLQTRREVDDDSAAASEQARQTAPAVGTPHEAKSGDTLHDLYRAGQLSVNQSTQSASCRSRTDTASQ